MRRVPKRTKNKYVSHGRVERSSREQSRMAKKSTGLDTTCTEIEIDLGPPPPPPAWGKHHEYEIEKYIQNLAWVFVELGDTPYKAAARADRALTDACLTNQLYESIDVVNQLIVHWRNVTPGPESYYAFQNLPCDSSNSDRVTRLRRNLYRKRRKKS